MINIDINIGDIILVGRFKNKRVEVKEIGVDEYGNPTINGKSILKIRIEKFMKPNRKVVKEGPENDVIFVINNGKLDDIFLDSSLSDKLDYENIKGDSFYVLPSKYYDRFADMADSNGFIEGKDWYEVDRNGNVLESKQIKEDTKINLILICVGDGIVQTTMGTARSAEIKKGDVINVTRENEYFYFGIPAIKGKFQHSPGLSGVKTHNPNAIGEIEVAINKKNAVNVPEDKFWATFKIQKPAMESKQFKLAEAVKKILKESKKKESGLMVFGKTPLDNSAIGDMLDETDYYAEWNTREGYWLFPEEEDNYDSLEAELEREFNKRGIDVRFEGIF